MASPWERLAGHSGGTVAALATGVAADGQMRAFAATPVGLYSSSDAGHTWTLPDVTTTVPFVEALAVSPQYAQDATIFICAGDGLYVTSDSGQRWQQVLTGSRMLSVVCALADRSDGLMVLAGTETDGVLRSDDGGRTWTGANAGLLDLTASTLAVSPAFSSDRTGFVGTPSGLYRTRNGALSWRAVDTGLDETAVQCVAMSPSFAHDRLVLAGTETDGLLRSIDAGATWQRAANLEAASVIAIAFSAAGVIAAATEAGVALSRDGGATWQMLRPPSAPVLSLVFARDADDEVLVAGLHREGIVRLQRAEWSPANAGLNARLLTGLVISSDFAHDRTLFAAGPQDGVLMSVDGGRAWIERNNGLGTAVVFGVAAATDALYAATSEGLYVSRDRAATWRCAYNASAGARLVATAASQTVFAALEQGVLLISDDAGGTWRTLAVPFGDTEVVAIAASPAYARDGTIFVATRGPHGAVLWRSTDRGQSWQRWLAESDRPNVLPVAVAPTYAADEMVFVGLGRRVLKPVRNSRETRAGERRPIWRGTEVGSPASVVLALAVSPTYADDRAVFAATNVGVFVSRDAGGTFTPWSDGLTHEPVVALAQSPSNHEDGLVFGIGLGGTIWQRRGVLTA